MRDEVNACIGGEVPVGPQTEAPAANCPDALSQTAAEIQAGFIQTATEQIATRTDLLNPEFINVVLCGTGSPIPSPRTQSCTAVFIGGKFFLFDAGDGASRSIESLNLPLINLEAIFTHFHSDHIAGVGEVVSRSWILGRQSSLKYTEVRVSNVSRTGSISFTESMMLIVLHTMGQNFSRLKLHGRPHV